MKVELRKSDKIQAIREVKISGSELSPIVKYNSTSSTFAGISDFSEYDFLYRIAKDKFNDTPLLSYISTDIQEKFDKGLESLKALEYSLFPTFSQSDTSTSGDNYFGIVTISEVSVILLDIPEGYDKIEFYDLTSSVVIEANLDGDGEKECRNVVWFLIKPEEVATQAINVSYSAYNSSINPCRNKKDLCLRNDELYSSPSLTSPFKDLQNGNILGQVKVSDSIIARSKLGMIDGSWQKKRYYREGEVVSDKWLSLQDGSGNVPSISPAWIDKEVLSGKVYKAIEFRVNAARYNTKGEFVGYSNSTIISPGNFLCVYNNPGNKIKFTVDVESGYSLYSPTGSIPIAGEDYSLVLSEDKNTFIFEIYYNEDSDSTWQKILKDRVFDVRVDKSLTYILIQTSSVPGPFNSYSFTTEPKNTRYYLNLGGTIFKEDEIWLEKEDSEDSGFSVPTSSFTLLTVHYNPANSLIPGLLTPQNEESPEIDSNYVPKSKFNNTMASYSSSLSPRPVKMSFRSNNFLGVLLSYSEQEVAPDFGVLSDLAYKSYNMDSKFVFLQGHSWSSDDTDLAFKITAKLGPGEAIVREVTVGNLAAEVEIFAGKSWVKLDKLENEEMCLTFTNLFYDVDIELNVA